MSVLTPYSYNGTSLSSSDYDAFFPQASAALQMGTNPTFVKRAGAVPVFAGKDFNPTTITLSINLLHDFTDLWDDINDLFDTKDETPRQLICTTTDSVQWYVYATPKEVLGGHEGPMVTVTLALDDPIWQTVTQTDQTWSITSSTSTTDVVITGNDDVYPIFRFTPTTAPTTDFAYSMYCQVLPTSTDPYPNRFLDITGATDTTWDTAALVAAGKMQADGDDIRVLRDGVYWDYWLNGINTTDTHVIVRTSMPPARTMTLQTALTTDTTTEIVVNYDRPGIEAFEGMPSEGRLIVDTSIGATDTEEFTYTAKSLNNATRDSSISFTIEERGVRNTTVIAHAAGSNVRFLPHDWTIQYGNATSTSYDVDDTKKPLMALTSRNNSFTFTNFWSESGLRAGTWQKHTRRVTDPVNSVSNFYTSTNDAGDTDPATAMGLYSNTYEGNGIWNSDTVRLAWLGYFPDGVATVSASGTQNQSVAAIPTAALRASADNIATSLLWRVDAQPSTNYETWTAWSKSSSDATIPAGTKYLIWWQNGTIAASTDEYSKVDITSLTVTLTNPPHVMIRGENSTSVASRVHCTIVNTTTGERLRVNYPLMTNETLVVNTDPGFPTAKHKGVTVNGSVALSSVRAAWLKLVPGTNTLTYDTHLSVAHNVTIVVRYRNRLNLL